MNGCQFKIPFSAIKLASLTSFESINSFELKTLLVRQSQIVQSVIYGSDTVVTQVLLPAILSLGSQLSLFHFAECEQTKT